MACQCSLGRAVRALWALGMIVSVACKSPEREPEPSAAPAAEPLHFSFALPSHYTAIELSGEGSESLRAPPGARVTRSELGARVEAGPDFAIEITQRPKSLAEMKAAIAPARRRLEENDLVVFDVTGASVPGSSVPGSSVLGSSVPGSSAPGSNGPGSLAFVSVRELVPEWDENDRRQFACNSVGAGTGAATNGAEVRAFSKVAVQNMVAACRTLELPRLE